MKIIGIIGGGQLARMLALSAYPLGFKIVIYSNEEDSSATLISNKSIIGDYNDEDKLLEFASSVDILTFEFENIDYQILKKIEDLYPNKLFPKANSLCVSNNRFREKKFFNDLGIKTAKFWEIKSFGELKRIVEENDKTQYIIKTCEQGYDGKGQIKIDKQADLDNIKKSLMEGREYILEEVVNFKKEVSIILVRSKTGEISHFPIPENIHKDGILRTSFVPNSLSIEINNEIERIGEKVAKALEYIGIMAIEFFIDKNDGIIVNEMAPRVHNSGHYTQNACNISQFEAHIRAISGLSIREIKLLNSCKMRNLIGNEISYIENFFSMENAYPHIYGKNIVKEGRKMAHVNIINTKLELYIEYNNLQ